MQARGALHPGYGPGEEHVTETRVAIAGLGAIGRVVARRLADGMLGLTLACVASRGLAKARTWLDEAGISCPLIPFS